MISREKIDLWRKSVLQGAGAKTRRTLRSKIINAKQVFATKVLDTLRDQRGIELANPFAGIELPRVEKTRHETKVKIDEVLTRAAKELRDTDSPDNRIVWRVFLLAISGGLRRKEIDNLRWQDIDLEAGRLNVRSHGEYSPKTSSSNRSVPIDPEVVAEMHRWPREKKETYVIPAKPGARKKGSERATGHYEALNHWLRDLEIDGVKPLQAVQKPTHELRKEAGSMVNTSNGIQQARVFLGHSNINTTADYYLDSSGKSTTGIGHMLHGPEEPQERTSAVAVAVAAPRNRPIKRVKRVGEAASRRG